MDKYIYIQGGRAHWIFTRADLPEWTPDFEAVPYPVDGYQPKVGDLYADGVFSPAPETEPVPEPVPVQVPRAHGKTALIQAGLWPAVLAYVAGIEDPTERALAEVALHDTTYWRRDSPFLNAAAVALNLSQEQLDSLFRTAHALNLDDALGGGNG